MTKAAMPKAAMPDAKTVPADTAPNGGPVRCKSVEVTRPPATEQLPKSTVPAAEPLPVTPLPRSASLARYRKPGLFGLIGSWLRLAARRPKLPEALKGPARKKDPPGDDVGALRAENKRLRRELEALLALREAERANSPPWVTTPAGDAPARPRRRGGTRP